MTTQFETSHDERLQTYMQWWKDKRAKRNGLPWFCAVVKQNERGVINPQDKWPVPRPERVVHIASAVFTPGYRHYAFAPSSMRDKFVRTWATAHSCEDPIP